MTLLRLFRLPWWLLAFALSYFPAVAAAGESMLVYVGTYTGGKSKGIYVCRLDEATGKLSSPELAAETKSPSFVAIHPNRRFLYAVGEMSNFGGTRSGAVSAFSLDPASGKLTLLNEQASGGAGPCHLAVDKEGKCVLVANYGSGSIAALPIQKDGSLAAPSAMIQHEGSSVNPERQAGPHAHFITTDASNHVVLACDLGLDKVMAYRLDVAKASLVANDPASVSLKAGSGPRHLAFHPGGHFAYVISEMSSTLSAFAYDSGSGVLKELQTVSTLPSGFRGDNSCAEVEVHPSGKFIYASNRGHDSVAIFAIEPNTGKLSLVEHQSTQGKTPRHFGIDPTGRWLLAENQGSDTIVVFQVNSRSGRLQPIGQVVEVGSPVCVAFVRAK